MFALPFNLTVDDILDPAHSSKPRNNLIAQVFYDMELIEQYGTGIGRMFDLCIKAGLPMPKLDNFSGGFRISFKAHANQVAGQVTGQVIQLLKFCQIESSRQELANILEMTIDGIDWNIRKLKKRRYAEKNRV